MNVGNKKKELRCSKNGHIIKMEVQEMNKLKDKTKRLPADFQSGELAWLCTSVTLEGSCSSVKAHRLYRITHTTHTGNVPLRFDSPGYIYTPLKERDEFIKKKKKGCVGGLAELESGSMSLGLNATSAYPK